VRNMIGVIPLVKGGGHLGASKPRWSDEGVNGCHGTIQIIRAQVQK
jgi:hypothetical protein